MSDAPRNVSLTLQNNEDARPIVEAILADNEGAIANHFPSMVKIDCPGRLVVDAGTVSEKMGRTWDAQEIHLSLVSLSGAVDEEDGRFVLQWR